MRIQLARLGAGEPEPSRQVRVELDPAHTGSLFQLGYSNDLAGNDDEAIQYYERCLKHPPVHLGAVNNLGILYEDNERYDKAVECFGRAPQEACLTVASRLLARANPIGNHTPGVIGLNSSSRCNSAPLAAGCR